MKPIPGAPPATITQLPRAEDRLSFVYLERCTIHRDNNAITAQDERGVIHLPAATLGAVLVGPGARVTHAAMTLLADSGATVVWVGEQGVRYYAHGRSLARTSRLLEAQARIVSNQNERLRVARAMYAMRFAGEDTRGLTMQQLRGREGARMRKVYREAAEQSGVEWKRRDYRPDDFESSDPINQAMSAATTCLYGVVHSVIVALGCSPGLGIVHTGHARSFVFDIADLYKAEMAVPAAFEIVGAGSEDIPGDVRRRMRDKLHGGHLLTRCAADIRRLLSGDDTEIESSDVVYLWDGGDRVVASGVGYATDEVEVPW
ncbi:type I-E CRISPR-associated endonuclease Cas1e [Arsenicicoccus cauae]|uniref:type I-E CRISPR-associated endonuclease Cas1e n=1 Tax=Arsenicicoccus cauae TaxID=2663847 RepID=UPI00370D6D44